MIFWVPRRAGAPNFEAEQAGASTGAGVQQTLRTLGLAARCDEQRLADVEAVRRGGAEDRVDVEPRAVGGGGRGGGGGERGGRAAAVAIVRFRDMPSQRAGAPDGYARTLLGAAPLPNRRNQPP